jgi:hypothetical protein
LKAKGGFNMDEKKELIAYLYEILGDEGCCMGACSGNEIYKDDNGWNLFLEGFMEPWRLGRTMVDAKKSIREYARMGFGLI